MEEKAPEVIVENQNIAVQKVEEEANRSDRESIESSSSINDGMKQLKNFKVLISEKTEAKSIKLLNRSLWFLILVLLTLASLILGFRVQENLDVKEG